MFCRNCGAENEDNAKFCRSCGLPIVPDEETVVPETPAETESDTVAEETVETPAEETSAPEPEVVTENQAAPNPAPNYGQPNYGQPNYGQPNYGQPNNYGPQYQQGPQGQPYMQQPKQTYSAGAIVSMILGIVSIVCCCSCIPGLGCGIAAICIAISEKNKGRGNGMVTAGLVCGIVGASISAIYLIFFIVTGSLADFTGSLSRGRIQDAFDDMFNGIRFRF